jgi:hypothetical protein
VETSDPAVYSVTLHDRPLGWSVALTGIPTVFLSRTVYSNNRMTDAPCGDPAERARARANTTAFRGTRPRLISLARSLCCR